MIYITSDLHFYHKNIIKFQPNRNSSTIEEMNEKLIEEWNSKVKDSDTIYHLGDFSFKNPKEILNRLNGDKIFIMGNHDNERWFLKSGKFNECVNIEARMVWEEEIPFGQVHKYLEIKYKEYDICLFHFPITHWHKQEYGSLHFYGHTHGSFDNHGRSMDVGYDKHNKILSLDEAIDMIKDREIIKRVYGEK